MDLSSLFTPAFTERLLVAAAALAALVLALKLFVALVGRVRRKGRGDRAFHLFRKLANYAGFLVIAAVVLSILGVDVTALLGAAGIAGVAIGFAAQTSFANLISGLFLVSEQFVSVGDAVSVGEVSGTVQSMDSLSVKIRTWDNQSVRIPNDALLREKIVNIGKYPIRRFSLKLVLEHDTDLPALEACLRDLARRNELCLDEPEPLVMVAGVSPAGIHVEFGVWFAKEHYAELTRSIAKDTLERLAREGFRLSTAATIMQGP